MANKIKQQMILQFNGQEADISAVEASVKQAWKDAGNKMVDINSREI